MALADRSRELLEQGGQALALERYEHATAAAGLADSAREMLMRAASHAERAGMTAAAHGFRLAVCSIDTAAESISEDAGALH